MRITTEKLLELAQNKAESQSGVVSGYVIGSVAGGDPVFGGTADVDLVLIHEYEPIEQREIVPLSDEVHLDIFHHPKRLYEQPRDLRLDPWLGPAMCEPIFLHDPSHFFEWAQASVRGQFHRPDNVHARGIAFLELAHGSLGGLENDRQWLSGWLRAVLEIANAVASLDGFPAAGRRVMPQLQAKLAAVGHPEIYDQILQMLGAEDLDRSTAEEWTSNWKSTFSMASDKSAEPELAEIRRDYHMGGFLAPIEEGLVSEIVWPLLSTWDRAIRSLPAESAQTNHWSLVLNQLGLSVDHASERESDLENLLDQVEDILETWAEKVGA